MTKSERIPSRKEGPRPAVRSVFLLEKSLLQQEKAISRLMFRGLPVSQEEARLQATLESLRQQRQRAEG